MNVRIQVGAQNAYAFIQGDSYTLDVLLHAGRAPAQSLRESATELREKSARLLVQAERMESAANCLAQQKVHG